MESQMPKYRFSGIDDMPPDRGAPDGERRPFKYAFEARDDAEAREKAHKYKEDKYKVVKERLIRVVQEEVVETIEL